MNAKLSWIGWTLVILLVAGAGFWLVRQPGSSTPQLASGTWLPQPRPIRDLALIDHTGRPFTNAQLAGQPSLVFFGFTNCPDICPTTLALLSQVRKAAAVPTLRVLFISVDPDRDTPTALAQYVRAFDPQITGLTGDAAALDTVAAQFGVARARVALPGGGYTVDHSAAVFLLDARGRMVALFTPPFDRARLVADVQRAAARLDS